MLPRARKGDSTVLGYALLIAFAIGMAGAVYVYLKFYVPIDPPSCPEGVSLIVSNVSCTGNVFAITLTNKGLFSVNGSYIKVGEVGRVYKEIINCPGPEQHAPFCQIYFNTMEPAYVIDSLRPGESWSARFNYAQGIGTREIQIEPLVFSSGSSQSAGKVPTLCKEAVITTTVACT